MAQAADADQYAGGIGWELGPGAPDRVVRRQAGIGQRRRGHRIQSGGQWHQVALMRDQQVVGHPAVVAQPAAAGQRRPLAIVLHADKAPRARAASPCAVDGHSVTLGDPVDPGTDGVYPAGILMAQRHRQLPDRRGVHLVEHM